MSKKAQRQSIRLTKALEGLTGIEIRDAAEWAVSNGWRAGEPLGTITENVIRCCLDLQIKFEGEVYPAFIAPAEERHYEDCVFIGSVEDGERELMGTLEEVFQQLQVLELE